MSKIARWVEDAIRIPVIDETGLEGRYNSRLEIASSDVDSPIRSLKKHGLSLERSRESIEVFVVRAMMESDSHRVEE